MPSPDNEMTIDERRKYLLRMRPRYLRANRLERQRLLDEMEQVTELHRKSLIRLLRSDLVRTPRQHQRARSYGSEVEHALALIAESFDYLCAERLSPNLPWMAAALARHGELSLSPTLKAQLERISVATVRRMLLRLDADSPRLPRRGPERANQVRRDIPARRIPWHERHPGHFEVDLVHHSGPSATGEYVHSLQMIDVTTGWSERVGVLGRSYIVMADAFRRILARLPFPVLEVHSDNGSEFLNAHLIRFWHEAAEGIELSRSRPYQKNDNRFVEQKNATLIRALLGFDRLDSVSQTQALNRLYDKVWLYYNLFQPVMRLCEKTCLKDEAGQVQVKRRYDQAQTPFDRLCATAALSSERREALEQLRERTNPRQLRQEVYDLIEHLFTLPGAAPGRTEDIYLTLSTPAAAVPILTGAGSIAAPAPSTQERRGQPGNILI